LLDDVVACTAGLELIFRDYLVAMRMYTLKNTPANPKPDILKSFLIFRFITLNNPYNRDRDSLRNEVEHEVLLKPPAVFIVRGANMATNGTLDVHLEADPSSTLSYL
jgi:hypothetical protein